MKKYLWVVLVPVMATMIASGVAATTVDCDLTTFAGITTYTYSLTSSETGDLITWFHVYAPVPGDLVSGWSETPGWSFGKGIDEETGDADIYWYVDDQENGGLADGETLVATITTSSTIPTVYDHELPGCFGNWGFESQVYAGWGALIMWPSVPVPQVVPQVVPEPSSLFAVFAGIVGVVIRCRRSSKA